MAVDEARLQETLDRVVTDMAAAWSVRLVYLGDKLGLYRAMAGAGPLTPAELARRTGTGERYVREWLCNQASSGYVDYDPATGDFRLTDEQAAIFADEESTAFLPGIAQGLTSTYRDEPTLTERFRTGEGVGWHEHDPELFHGTARRFKPGYVAHLVSSWIPALDGVADKLARGASVADVGCGHGISTVILAQAYPTSTFVGYDYHQASVERARKLAAEAGVGDRVRCEVASAKDYPGNDYDLVTFFDCLHDMGDPVGAARHVRETLADDGTWMIVEPYANDRLEDNANPVGQIFYAASTLICTGTSLAQEGGLALGAQAGETRLRSVVEQAGFRRFRRAAETQVNLILEARP